MLSINLALAISKIVKSYKILFRDDFSTDRSGPLGGARFGEPGPGMANINEVDGQFAITNKKLVYTAQASPIGGDLRYNTPIFNRQAGLALWTKKNRFLSGNQLITGFDANYLGSPSLGSITNGWYETVCTMDSGVMTNLASWVNDVDYDHLLVYTNNRYYAFIRGYNHSRWTLIWTEAITASTVCAALSNTDMVGLVDGIEVRQSKLSWPDYGLCLLNSATPSFNVSFNAHQNFFLQINWTPGSGETFNIYFRRTDDNNMMILRCSQSGSTVKIIKKEAGVETEITSAATTWTVATSYRLTLIADYDISGDIRFYVHGIGRLISTTSPFNRGAIGIKVPGAGSRTNLQIYPLDCSKWCDQLTSKTRCVLGVGDSKTAYNTYELNLMDLLNVNKDFYSLDWPDLGTGGQTVAGLRIIIDNVLSYRSNSVDYILINLGSNDSIALPVESTFKTELGYILDAFHVKYPLAKIALMRPWRRYHGTECNSIANWISSVVSTRSPWCILGPDERVFLENGDDGVTYTVDGVHPNAAGYTATASLWKTILGY